MTVNVVPSLCFSDGLEPVAVVYLITGTGCSSCDAAELTIATTVGQNLYRDSNGEMVRKIENRKMFRIKEEGRTIMTTHDINTIYIYLASSWKVGFVVNNVKTL